MGRDRQWITRCPRRTFQAGGVKMLMLHWCFICLANLFRFFQCFISVQDSLCSNCKNTTNYDGLEDGKMYSYCQLWRWWMLEENDQNMSYAMFKYSWYAFLTLMRIFLPGMWSVSTCPSVRWSHCRSAERISSYEGPQFHWWICAIRWKVSIEVWSLTRRR